MLQPYIVCPKCGVVSHNRNDIDQRYCGNCHDFHDNLGVFCRVCGTQYYDAKPKSLCLTCKEPLLTKAQIARLAKTLDLDAKKAVLRTLLEMEMTPGNRFDQTISRLQTEIDPSIPRYNLPRELYPFTLELLHHETREVLWSQRVEAPEHQTLVRIPGRKELGAPVTVRVIYANGEVME